MRNNIGWFRGKWKETGEWVQGYYVHLTDYYKKYESHRIYPGTAETDCGDFYPDYFEVDPDTVGGCTGLRDRNKKMIFEGDVIEGDEYTYEDGLGEILYDTESAKFQILGRDPNNLCLDFDYYYGHELEVVGNLWDNPELLGGSDNA